MDEDKLVNTKCVCIPGGCISDLTAKVNTFPTSSKLRRLVLVVGGNDCDSRADDKPVPDILTEYESLIKNAQEISLSITVSSICPRNKPGAVKERIEALNAGLKVLCDDLNADYVDNGPRFHLEDGSINDGYLLPDGTHLTKAATNKLVANLKLQLRHGETSAHADHRRRQHTVDDLKVAASGPHVSSPDPQPSPEHPFWRKAYSKAASHKPRRQGTRPSQGPPLRQPQALSVP